MHTVDIFTRENLNYIVHSYSKLRWEKFWNLSNSNLSYQNVTETFILLWSNFSVHSVQEQFHMHSIAWICGFCSLNNHHKSYKRFSTLLSSLINKSDHIFQMIISAGCLGQGRVYDGNKGRWGDVVSKGHPPGVWKGEGLLVTCNMCSSQGTYW